MPSRFTNRIMRLLTRSDYQGQKAKALAQSLNIPAKEYDTFQDSLEQLRGEGRVVVGAKGRICLPEMSERIEGTYQASKKGFGFVRPDKSTAEGDLYIPIGEGLDAVSGDRVVAKVIQRGRRGGGGGGREVQPRRLAGRIVEVLSRGQTQFVGTLQRKGRGWFVQPDGKAITELIAVDDPSARDAVAGDKVLIEILTFPKKDHYANGVIIERLGKSGTSKAELKGIIRQYQLDDKFSRSALNETRRITHGFDAEAELANGGREDIRRQNVITIDPADARDFDDAISLKRLPRGHWQLGVHIADVSHFVEPGSHLDKDSQRRGTSVYLPRHVIPMLPELLSNGICSLQEGKDRLVKSVYIKLDEDGGVLSTRFANSVMRSARRLAYEDADRILEGTKSGFDSKIISLIKKMEELAQVLQKRRRKDGMLTLEMPKAELVYDSHGHVIDAHPESTSFSHTIIEMFMLEANEAAARLLDSLNVPFLRRVHAEPDGLVTGEMVRLIKLCGYVIPGNADRIGIQKLLNSVRGKPQSFVVNLAVLKSLQRAEYNPASIGHYALASRHYCHFTSPIRRYPDLTVHRLLQGWIDGSLRKNSVDDFSNLDEVEQLGVHCSERERNAASAENDLRTVKLLQMLSGHVGEDMMGMVVSITNFGVFVQLEKYLIEGLVTAEDALRAQVPSHRDGKKKSEKSSRSVASPRRGRFIENCPYKPGQELRVRIAGVNVAGRTFDLVPVSNDRTKKTKKRR